MPLPSFIIRSQILAVVLFCCGTIAAQKLAVIAPEQGPQTEKYMTRFSDAISDKVRLLDGDMSFAAYRSVKVENPYNLTADEAKQIGNVVGCEYAVIIKVGTLRRASFEKDEFYESFASLFLVNTRTGRLVHWNLASFEADSAAGSEALLLEAAGTYAGEISAKLDAAKRTVPTATGTDAIEDVPAAPDTKNFHPPMPFKRIKPEYTRQAYFYDVRATVDAAVEIDQNGSVTKVEIERWAGFGLDESVAEAVRKMNWRPAERNGRTLPMRVLLRYNFTKIEKE